VDKVRYYFFIVANESHKLHLTIIESFFSLTCYQTWITTTQAGAQMFAATNALKKPVTTMTFSIILKLLVHLLQMGAARAQEIK
jgi:hypothetical protein